MELFEVYDAPSTQLISVRDALRLRIGNGHGRCETALLDAVEDELRERQQCDQLVGALASFDPFTDIQSTADDAPLSLSCSHVKCDSDTLTGPASLVRPSLKQHNAVADMGCRDWSRGNSCDQEIAELPRACTNALESVGSAICIDVLMAARQAFKSERSKAIQALKALKPRASLRAPRQTTSTCGCPGAEATAWSDACSQSSLPPQASDLHGMPDSLDRNFAFITAEEPEDEPDTSNHLSLKALDTNERSVLEAEQSNHDSVHHNANLESTRGLAGVFVECSQVGRVILNNQYDSSGDCPDSELMMHTDSPNTIHQAHQTERLNSANEPAVSPPPIRTSQAHEHLPHVAVAPSGRDPTEHETSHEYGEVEYASEVGTDLQAPNHGICSVRTGNRIDNDMRWLSSVAEHPNAMHTEHTPSVRSSLVLEDSFTDVDERVCSADPQQHSSPVNSSPGAAITHVAFTGDASKMEAPAWSSFTAVESLTETCGARAGVSAWYVGVTENSVASSGNRKHPPGFQTSSADSTTMSPSKSASHWLKESSSSYMKYGHGETLESSDILEMTEASKPDLQDERAQGFLREMYEGGALGKLQAQAASPQGRSAEFNASRVNHTGSVNMCCHNNHSLMLCDLALDGFEDWKSRVKPTVQPQAQDISVPDTAANSTCSARLRQLSPPNTEIKMITKTKDLGETLLTTISHDDHSSSHRHSTPASHKSRPSEQTGPLRSPDQQCVTLTSVPTIGSLCDLSRGLIPSLPQIYPAVFPCFESLSALYWKLQHSQSKAGHGVPQRQHRPQHDAMLIENCLDRGIEYCEAWCTAHGLHGTPDPECMTCSTDGGHPRCSSKQLRREGTAMPTPSTPPGRIKQHNVLQTLAESMPQGKGAGRGSATPRVTVPGWVPQVSTALTQQRWYCIVAGADHPEVTALVGRSLKALGWQEDKCCRHSSGGAASAGEPHMWNLCWTWSVKSRVPDTLLTWQRVNHFQECRHLTRKDLLKQHLQRYAAMFENSRHVTFFQCMPTTFTLPREYTAFEEAFRHVSNPGKSAPTGQHVRHVQVLPEQKHGLNLWILKPSCLSRGRGIYLLDDLGAVACSQTSVIQRYVSDPYLYQGLKFDLRLYVLVTSFHPLEAFLYKEGFARFALVKYTNAVQHHSNTAIHLTNSTIQSADAQIDQNLPDFLKPCKGYKAGASKMSLSRLWPLLKAQGIDVEQLWRDIRATVLAALYSAKDSIPKQVNAFEMYGFDVIFDQKMKVWLLEVNASPSLGLGTELDEEVKSQLVQDVVSLVDPLPFDRLALAHVLKRRKQQRTGPARKSRRQGGGLLAGTEAEEREVLNADLHAVLKGASVRPVGFTPAELGQFERVAPCSLLEQFQRMQRS